MCVCVCVCVRARARAHARVLEPVYEEKGVGQDVTSG